MKSTSAPVSGRGRKPTPALLAVAAGGAGGGGCRRAGRGRESQGQRQSQVQSLPPWKTQSIWMPCPVQKAIPHIRWYDVTTRPLWEHRDRQAGFPFPPMSSHCGLSRRSLSSPCSCRLQFDRKCSSLLALDVVPILSGTLVPAVRAGRRRGQRPAARQGSLRSEVPQWRPAVTGAS